MDGYRSSMPLDSLHEWDASRIDYDDSEYIFTTLPQSSKDSIKRDGETECMCTGWFKRTIVSTPGFPSPIIHPEKVVYEVREVEGRGMGVFATEDIGAGDLIVAERPLLVKAVSNGARYRLDLSQEDLLRMVRDCLSPTFTCSLTHRHRRTLIWRKVWSLFARACRLRL